MMASIDAKGMTVTIILPAGMDVLPTATIFMAPLMWWILGVRLNLLNRLNLYFLI